MQNRFGEAINKAKQSTQKYNQILTGVLGIPLNGQQVVEVPNRNSYVYVQLRNNPNEVIQAFNDQVAPSYQLPVVVQYVGNRYIVIGRDTMRYADWQSFAPYLPRHGESHSFDPEGGGGGDLVFVYPRQITPLLTIPSGSLGGPNVIINPYTLQNADGSFKYIGNTGTINLTLYNPTGSNAVMVLICIDTVSGNPMITVGSGSYFPNTYTGTSVVPSYIPSCPNLAQWIPDSAIRLTSGTSNITWDNIYDVRQWIHVRPTGTGGGGGGGNNQIGIYGENAGSPLGTGTILNVRGNNAVFTISGSTLDLFITGSSGGGGNISLINSGTNLGTITSLAVHPNPLYASVSGSIGYLDFNGTLLNWEDVSAQMTGTPTHFILTGTVQLGTDRLYYNGLRQQRTTHYTIDLNGKGFSTLFTGTFGDVLILEYGNMGVGFQGIPGIQGPTGSQGPQGVAGNSNLIIQVSGTFLATGTTLNFGSEFYPSANGTIVTVSGTRPAPYCEVFMDMAQTLIGSWANSQDGVQFYNYYNFSSNNGDSFQIGIYCQAGVYTIKLLTFTQSTNGMLDVYLDGNKIASQIDFYSASALRNQYKTISNVVIPYDGYHVIKGIVNGKNASSSGFSTPITNILILPASY